MIDSKFQTKEQFEEYMEKVADVVITQYTQCTKALQKLFEIAPDTCWKTDGVGCCSIGLDYVEDGLTGPAYKKIIEMRNKEQQKILVPEWKEERIGWGSPIFMGNSKCDYHKENSGCVLGELKSPRCIAHYCEGDLDRTSFDYNYIKNTLIKILNSHYDLETGLFEPERNWDLVNEFVAYVNKMENEVRKIGEQK